MGGGAAAQVAAPQGPGFFYNTAVAIIKCSECGRAISDRAAQCVGCGAPLSPIAGFDIAPKRDSSPPPTPRRLAIQGAIMLVMLAGGIGWASFLSHRGQDNSLPAMLAALLIIGGLIGAIVTVLQRVGLGRSR
jgi:hypothetical protein